MENAVIFREVDKSEYLLRLDNTISLVVARQT